jgi:hypothetical protein
VSCFLGVYLDDSKLDAIEGAAKEHQGRMQQIILRYRDGGMTLQDVLKLQQQADETLERQLRSAIGGNQHGSSDGVY